MQVHSHSVSDIHGEQVFVDGRWFHAQRVFGRPVTSFSIGDAVPELAPAPRAPAREPDEWVACTLFRGCSSNEMSPDKVAKFSQAMIEAGGWGEFPMITGFIDEIEASDVAACADLVAGGSSSVWLSELGWSRLLDPSDIGRRYVQIDNGHHRMAAALIASVQVSDLRVPVADLRREEMGERFDVLRP